MRSANAMAIAGLGMLALAGCDSTQTRNERAKLTAQREIAAREPERVKTANPDVRVTGTQLVRGPRGAAVVVDVRSSAVAPLTDVPVTVGVRRGERYVALNTGKELEWFQWHLPAIPARGAATWVFRVPPGRALRAGDTAFAKVGVPGGKVVTRTDALPQITASALTRPTGARARVVVDNVSDVPQFGLQVYAVGRAGGRVVAAGAATVERLNRDQQREVTVRLAGRPAASKLDVVAVPTIFQ